MTRNLEILLVAAAVVIIGIAAFIISQGENKLMQTNSNTVISVSSHVTQGTTGSQAIDQELNSLDNSMNSAEQSDNQPSQMPAF